ncbi:hypothetical protein L1987_57935 [Smallanthus sonchifolius]|uniref:Uncharacterized protein n=1 Tax=Smallanthus sonchifolius TaxID=185202 RepID=A0ACB9DE65_9ASTR|nr:hypothetical protein L1987_57935 [Smallanthus sonchifolius]
MAPLSTNAISHFMHPAHKLNQLTTNTSYLCDGCKVPGSGSRFTCTICNFDLHDYCAECPTRLASTRNHQHPMSLVVHIPGPNQTESCQICANPVKGLAYQCKICNFWVHPLCVSSNVGHNQDRAVPSGSPSAAQRIVEQVGLGLATNAIYDQIKEDPNKVPTGDSNASGSDEVPSTGVDASGGSNALGSDEVPSTGVDASGVEVDDEGIFDAIKSGFLSFFESSSS